MVDSRTKNSSRNMMMGVINKALTLILPFITRTIIIYLLGADYLGIGTLFTSILSFLSLAELGISSAIVYSMYKPIAENDYNMISTLLAYYKKIYRMIGLAILLIGTIIVPFVPVLTGGDVPGEVNIYFLYYLYLINSVISYFFAGYKQSVFTAYQRQDIITALGTVLTVLLQISQIAVLVLTRNFYVYAFVPILFTLIQNGCCAYLTLKRFPNIKAEGNLPQKYRNEIKKKLGGLFGTKLNSVVVHSADTIVISAFLGLTSTAKYGNYYTIFNAVHGFIIVIFNAVTASIGNKLVTDTIDENYNFFKKLNFANAWLVCWCVTCFLCLYEPFMKLWMGREYCFGMGFVILLCLYFFIYEIQRTILAFKDAAGIWYADRLRPYVSMIINLVSNLILVQVIGIYGIVLSTILAFLISLPWANGVLFKHLFKRNGLENIFSIIGYLFLTISISGGTYLICNIFGDGFIALICKVGVCMLVPNVIFIFVFRKNTNYLYWKSLISNGLLERLGRQ